MASYFGSIFGALWLVSMMDEQRLDFAAIAIGTMLSILRDKFTDEEILRMLERKRIRKAFTILDQNKEALRAKQQ